LQDPLECVHQSRGGRGRGAGRGLPQTIPGGTGGSGAENLLLALERGDDQRITGGELDARCQPEPAERANCRVQNSRILLPGGVGQQEACRGGGSLGPSMVSLGNAPGRDLTDSGHGRRECASEVGEECGAFEAAQSAEGALLVGTVGAVCRVGQDLEGRRGGGPGILRGENPVRQGVR